MLASIQVCFYLMNPLSRRRFLLLSAGVVGSSVLAACAPYRDVDQRLYLLAIDAEAQARVFPDLADLRHSHAQLLIDENNRRCGIDHSGTSPQQCSLDQLDESEVERRVSSMPATEVDALQRARGDVLEAVGDITSESWLVLAHVYTDLTVELHQRVRLSATEEIALDQLEGSRIPRFNKAEKDLISGLRSFHEAAVYGLGTAEAFASDAAHASIFAAMGDDIRVLSLALDRVAAASGIDLTAAPLSYRLEGYEELQDSASADAFVRQLTTNVQAKWDEFIAACSSSTAAEFGLRCAGIPAVYDRLLTNAGIV